MIDNDRVALLALETPRLRLRTFQDADLDAFIAYRSDPEVARYQGWTAPYSRIQGQAFIAEMKQKPLTIPGAWYQLALVSKADSTLIGDCAFHILADDARQAEIGFTLSRSFQGQGFATEAVTRLLDYLFGDLQFHRVTAICAVENLASARLLERIGMRREGRFVENIWFKDRWGSEYLYAVLRREWLGRTHRGQT